MQDSFRSQTGRRTDIDISGVPPWEEYTFGDGLSAAIANFLPSENYGGGIVHGTDMVKFHVRLSGRRFLRFEPFGTVALNAMSTLALLHEYGVPKEDQLLTGAREVSITIAIARSRLQEYMDSMDGHFPMALDRVVHHHASQSRIVSTQPSGDEVRLVKDILGGRRDSPLRRLYIEAKTLELLHTILDHLDRPCTTSRSSVKLSARDISLLYEVRELLESHYSNAVRIESLSRQFGLNRNKLCSGFRSLFGSSIFDFSHGLRMDEAWRLLGTSDTSVLQIALTVGYSSSGAFSTAFQRKFGLSPTDVRELSREKPWLWLGGANAEPSPVI